MENAKILVCFSFEPLLMLFKMSSKLICDLQVHIYFWRNFLVTSPNTLHPPPINKQCDCNDFSVRLNLLKLFSKAQLNFTLY